MNLHEYQGKLLLEKFNVSIQKGYVANTPEEAVDCAKKLSDETGTNIFCN
jgi:succinyl-CoA synthetase beta subunit